MNQQLPVMPGELSSQPDPQPPWARHEVPQWTTSPREQDIPHTTLRVRGHEVTVATTRLVEPRGVRTQAFTMGQLTIGVGQSIATWGREERRAG